MPEIRFYHLERQTLEAALPALLSKALTKHSRILIKTPDQKSLKELDTHLWTYDPASFLPHGQSGSKHADRQPVLLTAGDVNENAADMLILINEAGWQGEDNFSLTCRLFDGRNSETLSAARQAWAAAKEAGHTLTYWQQGAAGWEQKDL